MFVLQTWMDGNAAGKALFYVPTCDGYARLLARSATFPAWRRPPNICISKISGPATHAIASVRVSKRMQQCAPLHEKRCDHSTRNPHRIVKVLDG